MTVDQAELGRALRDELRDRAAMASPPSDAWERFLAARSNTVDAPRLKLLTVPSPDNSLPMELKAMERSPFARRRRRWLYGVAAACVASAVAGFAFVSNGQQGPTAGDTMPPITSVPAPIDAQHALDVMDDYFDAMTRGDREATMVLFTPDATFTSDTEPLTRGQFEATATWAAARGVTYIDPACTAVGGDAARVDVTCAYGELDHLREAVAAPPLSIVASASITADGIRSLATDTASDSSPGSDVEGAFGRWVLGKHPNDVDAVACCGGAMVDDAGRDGELRTRYADEWAAYLADHDCTFETYDTACPAAVTEDVSAVAQPASTVDAGSASASALRPLSALGPDDVIIPTALPEGWAFYHPAQLRPDDPVDFSFWVSNEGPLQMNEAPPQEIDLRMTRDDMSDVPDTGEHVEIDGVVWWLVEEHLDSSVLQTSRWVARVGDRFIYANAWGTEARAYFQEFLAGLRAGPSRMFPATVVEMADDGGLVARSGSTTTVGEIVASDDRFRVRAVAQDDWVCWSLSSSDDVGGRSSGLCQSLAMLAPDDFLTMGENGDTESMVMLGLVSGSRPQVTIRVADTEIVVPTGGPNDVIDRQFFVTELSGPLYERVKQDDSYDIEIIG